MVGNTGTYLDSPFHRFADGGDLAGVPLASVADLPILLVDARGTRAVDMQVLDEQLADATLEGAAVLLHTGSDRDFGTPGHDVLVLEHLTRLGEVPPGGARLHAAPPAWQGVGTWPVRAYVVVERRADRQALGQSTDSAGGDGSGVPH